MHVCLAHRWTIARVNQTITISASVDRVMTFHQQHSVQKCEFQRLPKKWLGYSPIRVPFPFR